MQTPNPVSRAQVSNSSRSLHLAFVVKNEAVSRALQITSIGTGLGSLILPIQACIGIWTLNGFKLTVGLTSPEPSFLAGFGSTSSSATLLAISLYNY